jgi:hypothetical protein
LLHLLTGGLVSEFGIGLNCVTRDHTTKPQGGRISLPLRGNWRNRHPFLILHSSYSHTPLEDITSLAHLSGNDTGISQKRQQN